MKDKKEIAEIIKTHQKIRGQLEKKLDEFEKIGLELNKNEILKELCFCLLTPQSRAEVCWNCVVKTYKILNDEKTDCSVLEGLLRGVRFYKTKAKRLLEAKLKINQVIEMLVSAKTAEEKRNWLVQNVSGLGMKEATHFLRNIGMSEDLAILDRHILRKLEKIGVIKNIPASLTQKKYLKIEKKIQQFSKKIGIPVSHLDFVFWYQETGRIFK
ncbi:MAG: N-glycosylase/DNA lyase [Candidatus Omnitrophica bacterium]|nr:N-glycosylase/DNA lyase [Candidatus Omnitrophota bacterium]